MKVVNIIKIISKKEMKMLMDKGILKNTHRGFFNRKGNYVGHYTTCGNKTYIEDYYVDKYCKR